MDNPHQEVPDKVLHITPGQGGMASFKADFERDGVGGHAGVGHKCPDVVGPLEVIVQAGELQVILTLIRDSLPILSGWSTTVDFAMQNEIKRALTGGSVSYGRPRFTSSDPSDTPF
jgi:hypothetical protein